jgi:hypothetical protein
VGERPKPSLLLEPGFRWMWGSLRLHQEDQRSLSVSVVYGTGSSGRFMLYGQIETDMAPRATPDHENDIPERTTGIAPKQIDDACDVLAKDRK